MAAPPASPLDVPELIGRKRDGGELSHEEMAGLVAAYVGGDVAEEQMAALLMAGMIRGFSSDEAVAMTEAMIASGDTVDLSGLSGPTVDKHSTGGVGDTTTLVVAPLLAAAGLQVAKLSGRGLGHTGGTLDKLESIPGLTVELSATAMRDQVAHIGVAVAAATQDLVPADKRLYALRDVTGTVASPALIAASVMSKKIAGGAGHVILDVKAGDGAFMPDVADAVGLGRLCVDIGRAHGRRTAALVTDMSQPLGDAIGNAIEVGMAVEVLRAERPGRLQDLSMALAADLLQLTGVDSNEAQSKIDQIFTSGQALETFRELILAQGGDGAVVDAPWKILPTAPVVREWRPHAGTVTQIHCRRLGELAGSLGAGRQRKEDAIDPAVGIEVLVRLGEATGDGPAARVHARTEHDASRVLAELPEVVRTGDPGVRAPPLIHHRIGLGRAPR